MRKKLLLTTVVVMMMLFVACGNASQGGNSQSTETNNAEGDEFEGKYWYCEEYERTFYFNGSTLCSNFGDGGRVYSCKEIDGKYEIMEEDTVFATLEVKGTTLTWSDKRGEYVFTEVDESKYKETITSFVGKYWYYDYYGDGSSVVAYYFDPSGTLCAYIDSEEMNYTYTMDMENIQVLYDFGVVFGNVRTDEGKFMTRSTYGGTNITYTEITKEQFEALLEGKGIESEVPSEEEDTNNTEEYEYEFEGKYWYCEEYERTFYFNGSIAWSNFGIVYSYYSCTEVDGKYEINMSPLAATLVVNGNTLKWIDETGEYVFKEVDESKYRETITSFIGKYWYVDRYGDGSSVETYYFDPSGTVVLSKSISYTYTVNMEYLWIEYDHGNGSASWDFNIRTDEGKFMTRDEFGSYTTYTEITKEEFEALSQ